MGIRELVKQFLRANPEHLHTPTSELTSLLSRKKAFKAAKKNSLKRRIQEARAQLRDEQAWDAVPDDEDDEAPWEDDSHGEEIEEHTEDDFDPNFYEETHHIGYEQDPETLHGHRGEFHYHYSEDTDSYDIYTPLMTLKNVAGEEVHHWCQWYSKHGANKTRQQTAALAGKHYARNMSPEVMGQIMKALSFTKASLPVAPHKVERNTVEQSVHDLRMAKVVAIHAKHENDSAKFWRQKYEEEVKRGETSMVRWTQEIANHVEERQPSGFPRLLFEDKLTAYTPVFLFTDWHVGLCFKDFVGEYSFPTFLDRRNRLCMQIQNWLRAYKRPIDEIVIAVGGDLVEGALPMRKQHLLTQDLYEGDQVYEAAESLQWLIRGIWDASGKRPCRVYSVGGNHDRAGGSRKDDPNRFVAQVTAKMAQQMLPKEISWEHKDHVNVFAIYDSLFILTHGDKIANDPRRLVGAFRRPHIKDYVILTGHYHSHEVSQDCDITHIRGGSLIGYDPHAAMYGYGAPPSQCMVEVRRSGARPGYVFPLDRED